MPAIPAETDKIRYPPMLEFLVNVWGYHSSYIHYHPPRRKFKEHEFAGTLGFDKTNAAVIIMSNLVKLEFSPQWKQLYAMDSRRRDALGVNGPH